MIVWMRNSAVLTVFLKLHESCMINCEYECQQLLCKWYCNCVAIVRWLYTHCIHTVYMRNMIATVLQYICKRVVRYVATPTRRVQLNSKCSMILLCQSEKYFVMDFLEVWKIFLIDEKYFHATVYGCKRVVWLCDCVNIFAIVLRGVSKCVSNYKEVV